AGRIFPPVASALTLLPPGHPHPPTPHLPVLAIPTLGGTPLAHSLKCMYFISILGAPVASNLPSLLCGPYWHQHWQYEQVTQDPIEEALGLPSSLDSLDQMNQDGGGGDVANSSANDLVPPPEETAPTELPKESTAPAPESLTLHDYTTQPVSQEQPAQPVLQTPTPTPGLLQVSKSQEILSQGNPFMGVSATAVSSSSAGGQPPQSAPKIVILKAPPSSSVTGAHGESKRITLVLQQPQSGGPQGHRHVVLGSLPGKIVLQGNQLAALTQAKNAQGQPAKVVTIQLQVQQPQQKIQIVPQPPSSQPQPQQPPSTQPVTLSSVQQAQIMGPGQAPGQRLSVPLKVVLQP
ncbi:hypothetical protein Celaphus_00006482, partial [Cervus elaphus hippelaphus]